MTAIASPLSSPSHQQQTPADSPVNSTPTFQLRKQNVVTPTEANVPIQTVPSVAQTTTLNLHGINFSSLQGAMATFPGLQNVQVLDTLLQFYPMHF